MRVTRRDSGTQSHAGKNPQKPKTRTPVTRNYPKPDLSTRNPSLIMMFNSTLCSASVVSLSIDHADGK